MTTEYYKSLISDEEVIRELIKESKRREGKLTTEAPRLKPNLNFFQRTVVNLVSNNNRIDKSAATFQKGSNIQTPKYKHYSSIKKPLVSHTFERQLVLQTKLKFIRSREPKQQRGRQTDAKTLSLNHIIDSEESDGSANILDNKTINITKISRNYRSNKNSNSNIILISSDDSSTDVATNECSKGKIKKKHKHKTSKSYNTVESNK